jgi:hypothetical protein
MAVTIRAALHLRVGRRSLNPPLGRHGDGAHTPSGRSILGDQETCQSFAAVMGRDDSRIWPSTLTKLQSRTRKPTKRLKARVI